MPDFELVPLDEAERNTQLVGKRGAPKRQYIGYIERLEDGHAGKLKGSEGETTAAIRRRLGSAAKYLGKELVVQRVGDQLYFWKAVPVLLNADVDAAKRRVLNTGCQ